MATVYETHCTINDAGYQVQYVVSSGEIVCISIKIGKEWYDSDYLYDALARGCYDHLANLGEEV